MRCDGLRSKAVSVALISTAIAGAVPAMISAVCVGGVILTAKVAIHVIRPKSKSWWRY